MELNEIIQKNENDIKKHQEAQLWIANHFLKNETKMKKQELLDKEPENNEEFLTQLILLGLNKTQLSNALRALTLLHKVAYKSYLRDMSLQTFLDCVSLAEELNKNE